MTRADAAGDAAAHGRIVPCGVPDVGEFIVEVQHRFDRWITTALVDEGIWEAFETELVRRLVEPGVLFVDAGANLGWYALVASRLGARVLAFEPEPENYRLLRANVARNRAQHVVCHPLALGETSHLATLTLSPDNAGDFRIDSTEAGERIEAWVVPLDDVLPATEPVGFLKLDTQGSEVRILRGARKALARAHGTMSAIVEFWPYGLSTCGSSHHELAGILATFAGSLFEIDAVRRRLVPRTLDGLRALGDAGVYGVEQRGHMNLLIVPDARLGAVRDLVDGDPGDARLPSLPSRPFADAPTQLAALAACEGRVRSQSGENGVIAELVRRIRPRRFAVEICAGGGTGCSPQLRDWGWEGVMFDARPGAGGGVVAALVTAENVNALFADHGVPHDLGLLSIDVDGNDLWLLLALDPAYQPALVVIAYNATLGPADGIAVPYRPRRTWDGSNHFGASLRALAIVARARGYALVYCEAAGVNAFFVRRDLLERSGLVAVDVADAYRPPRYGPADEVGAHAGHRFARRRLWRIESEAEARRHLARPRWARWPHGRERTCTPLAETRNSRTSNPTAVACRGSQTVRGDRMLGTHTGRADVAIVRRIAEGVRQGVRVGG